MSKIQKKIVFGSSMWPGCGPFKALMEESGVRFLYLDITENLASMKKFLKARDTMSEFDGAKSAGNIGIPALILGDNERAILDIDELKDYLESLKWLRGPC